MFIHFLQFCTDFVYGMFSITVMDYFASMFACTWSDRMDAVHIHIKDSGEHKHCLQHTALCSNKYAVYSSRSCAEQCPPWQCNDQLAQRALQLSSVACCAEPCDLVLFALLRKQAHNTPCRPGCV